MSDTYKDKMYAKFKKDLITWETFCVGRANNYWAQSEPQWWRKLTKHRKRRASARQAISQVMKGVDKEVLFPLDKKPWIYYW